MRKVLEWIINLISTKEFWYFFIPTISTFLIYYISINTKNDKRYLLSLFKSNQKLSLKIQNDLKKFIAEFDAYNSIAFPEKNVTYGHFLEQMEESFKENLSDESYKILYDNQKKLTKPMLVASIDSFNKQNENLRLIDLDMQMVIRKARSIPNE